MQYVSLLVSIAELDHGYSAYAVCKVLVYMLAFAQCAYPWRDGQAELTWAAGSDNFIFMARHRVNLMTDVNALSLHFNLHHGS